MASKEEQKRRKELLAKIKRDQRAQKLAGLPASGDALKALFDYLDEQLGETYCDDTLRLTEQFAAKRGLAFEPLKTWLLEFGGRCDCEMLANVEEKFEDVL